MARKKAQKRRSRTPKINLINVSEALVQANFLTQGMFGTNVGSFITNQIPAADDRGSLSVTGWELISGIWTGNVGNISSTWQGRGGIGAVINENIKTYGGGKMVAGLLLTPLAFRFGKRLLSKGRNMVNRTFLKGSGVSV